MTFPHTLQERKGPFTCPRCTTASISWVPDDAGCLYLEHVEEDESATWCTWLDEATDEQVEALK